VALYCMEQKKSIWAQLSLFPVALIKSNLRPLLTVIIRLIFLNRDPDKKAEEMAQIYSLLL